MKDDLPRAFFEGAPVPFAVIQITFDGTKKPLDGVFLSVNAAFSKLWGIPVENILNRKFTDLMPDGKLGRESWRDKANLAIQDHQMFDQVVPQFLPGKSVRIRLFPISEDCIGCILRDVSTEVMLKEEVDGFMTVSLDMFCIADPQGIFLKVNRQFEEVLGYTVSELEGINFLSLIHPDDVAHTQQGMRQLMSQKKIQKLNNRYRCKDGKYRTLEWHAVPIGNVFYASARDITDQVEKEAVLRSAADTDPLTGLFNRHYLYSRIQDEITLSETRPAPVSMVAVDIDHFKYVNDIWGHPVGDEVLERTAKLLKACIRRSDFLARVGGEEFVALFPDTELAGALVVAKKMHEALNVNSHPRVGKVTASFGVAERKPNEDFLSWYKRADEAVYSAKERGRNQVVVAGDLESVSAPASLYMAWKDQWNSGNVTIDGQHRELVEIGNKLVFLAISGAVPHQISRQIDQLLVHVTNHFSTEEAILAQTAFPGLTEHREIHQNLIRQTTQSAENYLQNRNQSPIFLSFVINDLILGHLLNEDKKFFSYLPRES